MIQRLASTAKDYVNQALRQRGYLMQWRPQSLLEPTNQLDRYFDLAAAHLMLSKKDVFFIEIGANDGVANDPIYPFVRDHGWQGVMLEPLPEIHAALSRNYASFPGVRCVQAAMAPQDGEATLYSIEMSGSAFAKAHQFSTFRKETLLQQTDWVPNVAELIKEVRVPTLSWKSVLQHAEGRSVDVIQIDTEGYDAEIIKMIDFDLTKPSIVNFEHANLSKADQDMCAEILVRHGYRLAMNRLDVTAYRI